MIEKRGAIGLSIDALVMIIISLVILGGGTILLYKFIGGAEQIKVELDQRTAQELERLLVDQGQQVALPLNSATVLRGEDHVFGIGIRNIKADLNQFKIVVSFSEAFNEQNEEIKINNKYTSVDEFLKEWIFYDQDILKIEENEHRKESIFVTVPKDAETGKYIFVAKVLIEPFTPNDPRSRYGNPQTFFVIVE